MTARWPSWHIRTHLLLWGSCIGQAFKRDLQFRSQTLINGLSSVLELGLSAIPVLILTRDAGAASGWNGPRAVAVVGAYGAGSGIIDCFVAPNMRRIDLYVRRGDLDLMLIRPVNAFLHTALRWIEPAELGRVVTGLGLLALALRTGDVSVAWSTLLTAAAWAIIGIIGYSLIWANFVYLAFWADSAEPMNDVAVQLREAGKYPLAYFSKPVRLLLRTLVPAGLIAATPVDVLTGNSSALWAGACGLVIAVTVTAVHWRVAIRRYSSASS